MGKFIAYEGIDVLGSISNKNTITGSLAMTGSLTVSGSAGFTGAISLNSLQQTQLTNTNWYSDPAVVLGITGNSLAWTKQSNLFWGGGINYVNNTTNTVSTTGNWTFDQWNGTVQYLYISTTGETLIFDVSNDYQRDFYCTLVIMQSNLSALKTKAVWSGGSAWTTGIFGSRSTTNYSYSLGEQTMTSNNLFTCAQSPQATSLVHVGIDYSARKFMFHCTNWS